MYWETGQGSTCLCCLSFLCSSFSSKWVNPNFANVSCFCIKVVAVCMNQLGLSNFTSKHSALHNIYNSTVHGCVSPGIEMFDNSQ